MENDPHQLIEGMLIAGLAVDSHKGYIYIRGEYRYLIDIMDKAIAEAYAARLARQEHPGHAASISTATRIPAPALTSAARSRRCSNRSKASAASRASAAVSRGGRRLPVPHDSEQRRDLLRRSRRSFAMAAARSPTLGTPKNGGTRLFCLSGHVNKPGVYELPMGFNLLRMINEVGGGMRGGKKLKAVIPGGSSCPVLKAEECDLAMDYDSMAKAKSMLGSGGVVVMDEDTCMVKAALRIMRFYAHESCGWCIPCREGTTWLKKMLHAFPRRHGPAKRHRSDRRSGEEHARAAPSARSATRRRCRRFRSSRSSATNSKRTCAEQGPCPHASRTSLVDGCHETMADLVKLTIDGKPCKPRRARW